MKILKYGDLKEHGHDVYEFCYQYDEKNPVHWNKDSLYLDSDDLVVLEPYIDKVFENFHYFGPQRIEISEWEKIKILYFEQEKKDMEVFIEIDNWIGQSPIGKTFFWILGI